MKSTAIIPRHVYRVTYSGQDHIVFCTHPAEALKIVAQYLGIFE